MITKFDSSYYGTADMKNLCYRGTPINDRCYSKEELAAPRPSCRRRHPAAAGFTLSRGSVPCRWRSRVRAVDLRGRWLLIFFGYTSCPDLCPTTLSEIAGALAQLGPLGARVQPVFVSIAPRNSHS
jgi:hypothetical protein